jgi:hypothetical protein
LLDIAAAARVPKEKAATIQLEDFYAYMPEHKYIFVENGEMWPAASVSSRLPRMPGESGKDGAEKRISAAEWLDKHRAVEQMTWAPGQPMLIKDRLVSHGGWIERPGAQCFNLYRGPQLAFGDATQAGPWIEHLARIYPTDAEHITRWLAHRVQRPGEKINHAIVLGGLQGIGKDTLLEPVRYAVGPWNVQEVSPTHLLGRFNSFVKSVILRISEARDLGEINRFAFYDHMKVYTAAPPDVLRCDEKHLREYAVFNVCGVVLTTNHKTDGIYLPADDRRHYVAWSDLTRSDFDERYWTDLYRWFETGGISHVAAYLAAFDLSAFNSKGPPPKTAAFWDIVDSNRAPEDAELADVIDSLCAPLAVTLESLASHASGVFGDWLRDRKNRRQIPHRLESAGYVAVRNESAQDGLWKIGNRRQAVYARAELSIRDRLDAAGHLARAGK